jgi:putative heme iron utilization protein
MTREQIETDIRSRGSVERQHLLDFLKLLPTSDATQVKTLVRTWLEKLHNDPNFSAITFSSDGIDRVLGDLESYGRVTHETVLGAEPNIMERHNG